jgi:formylglycine-generating enzyme required for sulfatase activity
MHSETSFAHCSFRHVAHALAPNAVSARPPSGVAVGAGAASGDVLHAAKAINTVPTNIELARWMILTTEERTLQRLALHVSLMMSPRAALSALVLVLMSASSSSCAESEAPARGQVLLVVETNLPTVAQVGLRDDLSHATAVDTLRVDVLASNGSIQETREIVATDPLDWPISFGVAPTTAGDGVTRIRLRAFRSIYSRTGAVGGTATREPEPGVTIDRVVAVRPPKEGVTTLGVVLQGDCISTPSSFVSPIHTCIDESNKAGDPALGLVTRSNSSSATEKTVELGSWPRARFTECTTPQPHPDAICIRGGYGVVGEIVLRGLSGSGSLLPDSAPIRGVYLSPFWIDKYEMTVGRLRALGPIADVEQPFVPTPGRSTRDDCVWRGYENGSNDTLPVNCVVWKDARGVCKKLGGDLPRESQWEYAARGRGEQRVYPWGSQKPTCCALSADRRSDQSCSRVTSFGPEPVGSHVNPATCGGLADVSRDGVVDLAGSVAEHMLDVNRPYDAECWGGGTLAVDPLCLDVSSADKILRGSSWRNSLALAATNLRQNNGFVGTGGFTDEGFRCAYPGAL